MLPMMIYLLTVIEIHVYQFESPNILIFVSNDIAFELILFKICLMTLVHVSLAVKGLPVIDNFNLEP